MNLLQNIYDLSTESTFHGLNHIHQRQSKLWKLFWLILTIGGFVALSFGALGIFLRWSTNPTATDVSILSTDSMKLPNVVIGTRNILNLQKLTHYNISQNLIKTFQSYATNFPIAALFNEQQISNMQISDEEYKVAKLEFDQLLQRTESADFEEFFEKFHLKCQDFVLNCALNGMEFNCCTGLPNQSRRVFTGFALATGYQRVEEIGLDIRVSNEELVSGNNYYAPFKAIQLHLKGQSEKDSLYSIPSGKQTTMLLRETVIDAVNNPPSFVCNSDANYSRKACQNECLERLEVVSGDRPEECHCSNPFGEKEFPKYCDPWQWRRCSSQAPVKDKPLAQLASCFGKCLRKCAQTNLQISLMSVDFNPQVINCIIKTMATGWGTSVEEAERQIKSTTVIRVMYSTMEQVYVRQYFSMSFGSIISEMGGQMGLFLGASLTSFLHLVLFWTEKLLVGKPRVKPEENNSPVHSH